MSSSFNGQILVDKLAKLNNTQQSIETLSHWCIFHRNKAKQVVETWEQQFHCSPREQRVSFLYLANDILQNSRRKGLEFINEFWRVLPDALNDVYINGGEFGRITVLRLIGIWEERKVFGSHVQVLKDELLGRRLDNKNRNGKAISDKLKQPAGELMEKVISSYEHVCNFSIVEDAVFGRFQAAINFVEKADKELGSIDKSEIASISSTEVAGELQMHYGILRECVEQLKVAESSRATLVSYLREALNQQETKIEQVRHQLQAAQLQYEHAASICVKMNVVPPEQRPKDSSPSAFSDSSPQGNGSESATSTGERAQMTAVRYTQGDPLTNNNNPSHNVEKHNKAAAAAVAAKLASSTSAAQMLSYALSSLSSDGVIGQTAKDDYQSDNKRPRMENSMPCQLLSPDSPQSLLPPPLPPFPHPDSLQQPLPQSPSPISPSMEPPPPQPLSSINPSMEPTPPPPPPPSLPPALSQLPPTNTQFMPPPGSLAGLSYNYGTIPPHPNYPMLVMPPYSGALNQYNSFQAHEGVNFLGQPPFPPAPPLSRQ